MSRVRDAYLIRTAAVASCCDDFHAVMALDGLTELRKRTALKALAARTARSSRIDLTCDWANMVFGDKRAVFRGTCPMGAGGRGGGPRIPRGQELLRFVCVQGGAWQIRRLLVVT